MKGYLYYRVDLNGKPAYIRAVKSMSAKGLAREANEFYPYASVNVTLMFGMTQEDKDALRPYLMTAESARPAVFKALPERLQQFLTMK